MNHNLHKALIYLKPTESYWRYRPVGVAPDRAGGPVGYYPIDCTPRLTDGHYDRFNNAGLPLRRSPCGDLFINASTVASHAFAHWDQYLDTGREDNLRVVLSSADHFASLPRMGRDGALLLGMCSPTSRHKGYLSAMQQGQAMSLLVRAAQLENCDRYLAAACACLPPFTRAVDANGVVSTITSNGVLWYEEYAISPLRHVLNGMVYALWGLRDLAVGAEDAMARELYEQGVESVRRCLPLFDLGWWSQYSVSEDGMDYIASMMYHNLHIVMLTVLYEQTRIAEFQVFSERFRRQGRKPGNRLFAGIRLCRDKQRLVACRTDQVT